MRKGCAKRIGRRGDEQLVAGASSMAGGRGWQRCDRERVCAATDAFFGRGRWSRSAVKAK